jgi:hypothetical protein
LFYSLAGVLHPLRLVRIAALEHGQACDPGGECASGHCVDGVCCDSECEGSCRACSAVLKGHGEDGVCDVLSAGKVDAACPMQEVSSCGYTGQCDATGACASYAQGTVCNDEGYQCTDQKKCRPLPVAPVQPVNHCLDDHTALIGSPQREVECGLLKCSQSSGACLTRCTTNVDCVGENRCNSDGTCGAALQGSPPSVGCAPGCRLGSSGDTRRALWGSLTMALLIAARRARRKRATSLSAP